MSARVRVATDEDAELWDNYVTERELGHHSYFWFWQDVFHSVFGHKPFYLIAESVNLPARRITGILPLVFVRSVFFGRALISLPYLNGGGIISDDQDSFDALLAFADTLAQEFSIDYLELRHRSALSNSNLGSNKTSNLILQERSHKVAMILPLASNDEQLFGTLPAKLRSQVRRPTKSGMYAEVSARGVVDTRLINAFYSVFSHNMRDLGTPVYPRSLFIRTAHAATKLFRVIVIWKNDTPAAAGITIGCGKSVEIPWASSLQQFKAQAPNMLLYWQALKTACDDGYDEFDFGRCSPDSGSFHFKAQWGATPRNLHWYYRIRNGAVPDVNPDNSRFRKLVSCWQHLPLSIANLVGPWLTKNIP